MEQRGGCSRGKQGLVSRSAIGKTQNRPLSCHLFQANGYACDFLAFMMSIWRRFSMLAKLTSGS